MEEIKSKKLVNQLSDVVKESLQGLIAQRSELVLYENYNIICRSDLQKLKDEGKVTLLAGGGSGHEPSFVGFVSSGMLTAVVAGEVFTSPPPEAVLAALRLIGANHKAGVLIIINNYTGDRLNFGLAMEQARLEGIKVEMVLSADDCALQSKDKSAGRRGLAGCLLAVKVAGAMAQEGKTLQEISHHLDSVVFPLTGTIGMGLSPCSVPGRGPSFLLPANQIELGLGIHGEAGAKRLQLMQVRDVVKAMVNHMICRESATRMDLVAGERVVLLLNNLGGTSQLEFGIFVKETVQFIEGLGVKITRLFSGTLMTALEMAGVSISILKLGEDSDSTLRYLDMETSSPSWPKIYLCPNQTFIDSQRILSLPDPTKETSEADPGMEMNPNSQKVFVCALDFLTSALISCELQLNILDSESGDADCGSTIKRGAQALQDYFSQNPDLRHPKKIFQEMATCLSRSMGGSSGALFSLFLTGSSRAFSLSEGKQISLRVWTKFLSLGLQNVCKFGGSEPGDRTMVDPLHAFLEELQKNQDCSDWNESLHVLSQATTLAEESVSRTSTMKARAGRASYVDPKRLVSPDPGAHAIGVILRAILEAVKHKTKE